MSESLMEWGRYLPWVILLISLGVTMPPRWLRRLVLRGLTWLIRLAAWLTIGCFGLCYFDPHWVPEEARGLELWWPTHTLSSLGLGNTPGESIWLFLALLTGLATLPLVSLFRQATGMTEAHVAAGGRGRRRREQLLWDAAAAQPASRSRLEESSGDGPRNGWSRLRDTYHSR